jgi:hypothetical protein
MNEILAKLTQNEKLIGGGAVVAVIGWLFGMLVTDRWYDAVGAQGLGLLAVIAAVAAIAILYLKYAPNTNIAWPFPLPLILLVLAAVVVVIAAIGLLQAFTYDPCRGLCDGLGSLGLKIEKPITLYVAILAVLAGGAAMAYGAYMAWVAAGKPTANAAK